MGLLHWFTKNWANTKEPTHPDLGPMSVPIAPEAAVELIKKTVATLPHWSVQSETMGELKLTRRTHVIGFVDDVTVTIQSAGTGAIIHAASRSRVGVGDLGQNRRNILELWAAIRANS